MNPTLMPGCGNRNTWPPCEEHPHDPRTVEIPDELAAAYEVYSEVRMWLDLASSELYNCDLFGFISAMDSMSKYLGSMDFSSIAHKLSNAGAGHGGT